jgi:hypothetical protein
MIRFKKLYKTKGYSYQNLIPENSFEQKKRNKTLRSLKNSFSSTIEKIFG